MYYHVLGTDQSEDVLIYTDPEHPDWGCSAYVTVDGNWVIMTVTNGTDPVNKLWIAKLDGHSLPTNGKNSFIDSNRQENWSGSKLKMTLIRDCSSFRIMKTCFTFRATTVLQRGKLYDMILTSQ